VGPSEKLGPLTYLEEEEEVFLGRSVTQHKNVSDDTAHAIDEEIRAVIDRNYQRSRDILTEHIDKLHTMADALMKYETIDSEQIDDIMSGRTPRPPADWDESEPRTGGAKGRAQGGEEQAARAPSAARPGSTEPATRDLEPARERRSAFRLSRTSSPQRLRGSKKRSAAADAVNRQVNALRPSPCSFSVSLWLCG